MKKLIIFLALVLILITQATANEHLLFTGKCYEFNDLIKEFSSEEYAIKYDDKDDIFYLRTSDWINNAWIHLTWNDLAKLRMNLEKYFEWEKLAVEKSVKLEKALPNSEISTKVTWKFGDDWYSAWYFTLNFTFYSQNTSRHQLVLTSSKATGSNQFVTYKIDGYYFDKKHVQQLYDAINEEALKKQVAEIKKNKEAETLFN